MAIKISNSSFTKEVVGTLTYELAKIGAISYAVPTIAVLSYEQPVVSGIELDYKALNRVIWDGASLLETLSISLSRSITPENLLIEEQISIVLGRIVTDITSVLETSTLQFEKHVIDPAVITDALYKSLNKVLDAELLPAQDTIALRTVLNKQHEVFVTDTFNRVVQYLRHFNDYVAIDDWAGIDKYYTGTKHNIATAVDNASVVFNLVKHDESWLIDALSLLTTKSATEVLPVIDNLVVASSLLKNDIANLQESFAFYIYKTVAEQDFAITSDSNFWAFTKVAQDAIAFNEAVTLSVNTVLHDQTNPIDSASLTTTKYALDTAFVNAYHTITLNKITDDSSSVADSLFEINSVLGKSDNTVFSDAMSVSFTKVIYDGVAIDDFAGVQPYFNMTKSNITNTSDSLSLVINTVLNDSFGALSAKTLAISKIISDNIGISEGFDIQIITGESSLFNEMLFNSSTFG